VAWVCAGFEGEAVGAEGGAWVVIASRSGRDVDFVGQVRLVYLRFVHEIIA
jgi:hypothetical protein